MIALHAGHRTLLTRFPRGLFGHRLWILAALLAVASIGCQATTTDQPAGTQNNGERTGADANQADLSTTAKAESTEVARAEFPAVDEATAGTVEQESWDVITMQGVKVGYGHTVVKRIGEGADSQIATHSESHLSLARAGQAGQQTLVVDSLQHADGRLISVRSEIASGASSTVTKGQVDGDFMHFETTTTGKTLATRLPWQDDWSGYFAVEQSLRNNPLKAGETRQLKELQPGYNLLADVTLRAVEFEATEMRGGEEQLLRIESVTNLAGTPIASLLWTDEQGNLRKTSVPALQQTTYRTTREDALRESTDKSFDILNATVIRLNRRIEQPLLAKQLTYRVESTTVDPATIFVPSPRQQIERVDEQTALLTVNNTVGSVAGGSQPADSAANAANDDRPEPADSRPNNLVQSDDPGVMQMATSVAADQTDPESIAIALENQVHRSITSKNFSQAFSTAADVAKSLEGDCTEHAVLLAALCRARQIPARVAIGLVYFEQQGEPSFAYHMWTEAWTGERWLSLDATLGRGGIGVGHLKLTSSSLEGSDGYAAFLPVFRVMGQLRITIADEAGTAEK
ncbi:MAG: transglutaminase domain-containing protein [Planctomycetales bacterium]|nr:transglutaminase domain-containing protein [Planctomycetales bacterium]